MKADRGEGGPRRGNDGSKLICFKKLSVRSDGSKSDPSGQIKISEDGSDGSDGRKQYSDPRGGRGEGEKIERGGMDGSGGKNRKKPSEPSEPSGGVTGYRKKSDESKTHPSESDGYPSELDALLARQKEREAEEAERKKTPEPKIRDPTPKEAEVLQKMAAVLMKNWPEISAPQLSRAVFEREKTVIPIKTVERWMETNGWKKTGAKLNGGEGWTTPAQEARG